MSKIDATTEQVVSNNMSKNKRAILSVILFALFSFSVLFLNVLPPQLGLLISGVLGVSTFICALGIKETSKTEQLHLMEHPQQLDAEVLNDGLPKGFCAYDACGSVLTGKVKHGYVLSKEVNKLFTTNAIWAEKPDELYRFPKEVVEYTAYLKDYRNKELSKFVALRPDKAVMGLHTDITEEMFHDERPIVGVHNATRYAVQSTDDAFNKIIINQKKIDDKIVFDGHKLAIDDNGHLKPMSETGIANEIDIQSLMISNDGYIMFTKGTDIHPLHPNQIITSASCSLLPTEVENKPLQESMIDSIHAKIKVLYDIPQGTDMKSSFCGFARMIHRAGSPEFYCITLIDLTKDEILKIHRDPTSRFSMSILADMVPDLSSIDDAAEYISKAVYSLRKSMAGEMSHSASAMLTCIIDAMSDPVTAGKVLRRIGLIEDEYKYAEEQTTLD